MSGQDGTARADLASLEEEIQEASRALERLREEMAKVIVGQGAVLDRVLMGLLANGHLLLEGLPGLAKTLTFRTLAAGISARFQRIQFTPDLLPADVIGTTVFQPQSGDFTVKKGPIFANLVLADEINRAPAKVQSALLEAMQERQVTLGETSHPLPDPFLVLATQNPIEQEGTYTLPEAQVDRFLMKVRIAYPERAEEARIIDRMTAEERPVAGPVMQLEELTRLRRLLPRIYLDERVKGYVLDLVFATRAPEGVGLERLKPLIAFGASPRASLALVQAARACALLRGRGFVTPDDVKSVALDVLRHRVLPSYEAEADELDADALLGEILAGVRVP